MELDRRVASRAPRASLPPVSGSARCATGEVVAPPRPLRGGRSRGHRVPRPAACAHARFSMGGSVSVRSLHPVGDSGGWARSVDRRARRPLAASWEAPRDPPRQSRQPAACHPRRHRPALAAGVRAGGGERDRRDVHVDSGRPPWHSRALADGTTAAAAPCSKRGWRRSPRRSPSSRAAADGSGAVRSTRWSSRSSARCSCSSTA